MSGAINVSSNYGYGTKVKIILDQKIELEENLRKKALKSINRMLELG